MNDNVHVIGRGYGYEDLKVGFRFRTHRRTIAEPDLANFINLTWLAEWNVQGEMDWATASFWAAGLDIGGFTGWRPAMPVTQWVVVKP